VAQQQQTRPAFSQPFDFMDLSSWLPLPGSRVGKFATIT
jgi:hypothetical protein